MQPTTDNGQRTTIKESSDELDPPVVTTVTPLGTKAKRSFKDYLALVIATCGVGYLPVAPGTWGSLLALVFYLFLHRQWFPRTDLPPGAYVQSFLLIQLAIIGTLSVVGIWAASRTERVLRIKDPSKVVIDEVAGQLIALLAIPGRLWSINDAKTLVAAFILFRLFDIVKPYPARKLEGMQGGLGIMADDLVAGLYAFLGVMLVGVLS